MESHKIKCKVFTPIHIWSWDVYDRLDYFVFEWNDWTTISLFNQKWIEDLASKDKNLFEKVISSVTKWKFNLLEKEKATYYNNIYMNWDDEYLDKEISISDWAKKQIVSSVGNNQNNQWFINRQICNKISWDPILPWSTLKWIFRSAFLFGKIWESVKINSFNHRTRTNEIIDYIFKYDENSNRYDEFNKSLDKDIFNWLYLGDEVEVESDLKADNNSLVIKKLIWANKAVFNPEISNNQLEWIPIVCEMINQWVKFEINVTFGPWYVTNKWNWDQIKESFKNYSKKLIDREEKILKQVWFKWNLIEELNKYWEDWKYPIKIWMYKKSLAYKVFWDEQLADLNKLEWEKRLAKSRQLWVWDKSIYIDDDWNVVWWIILDFNTN